MKTEIIKFYGNDITCVMNEANELFVVLKPICDALGLDSDRQIKTISDDEVLGSERSEQTVQILETYMSDESERSEKTRQAGDNLTRKMICLPLEFVHGWLFQIKFTNTMSEETKEKLIIYKKSCYRALFDHFFGNFRKQLTANEIEIKLLEELNELSERKGIISSEIKEKKALLADIRKERLNNQLSLF